MDPDALGSAFPFPPWVLCLNSLTLYQEKVSLPEELKLSKKTLRQIRAVREWAARENKSRQVDFEASNDLPLTTPQTAPRVLKLRVLLVARRRPHMHLLRTRPPLQWLPGSSVARVLVHD